MKRVAVCFSGHMRLYQEFMEHFYEQFVHKNQGYDFDFFIDTWDKSNYHVDKWCKDITFDELINVFGDKLKKINIDKNDNMLSSDSYKDVMEKYKINHKGDGSHIINMFYKVYKCNELKREYENEYNFEYDVVIRHRTDYFINGELILDNLNMDNINIINNSIVLPNESDNSYSINDLFAISSSKNIDTYSNLYLRFHELMNKYKTISEDLITYYLEENGFFIYPQIKNMHLMNVDNSYVLRMDGNKDYLWDGYRIQYNLKKNKNR